jgi:hypothetical protein
MSLMYNRNTSPGGSVIATKGNLPRGSTATITCTCILLLQQSLPEKCKNSGSKARACAFKTACKPQNCRGSPTELHFIFKLPPKPETLSAISPSTALLAACVHWIQPFWLFRRECHCWRGQCRICSLPGCGVDVSRWAQRSKRHRVRAR